MITTGKQFEAIVEMLNNFRSEIKTFSTLGYLNINKHAENFIKRVLNLTYDYELENLNKDKPNYPGLDLGDSGEGIAFQITATKKSDKIDETLTTCLKHKHYATFKKINIFILTKKQSTYTIKTVTEPHFSFLPEDNIKDMDDLFKSIEHLPPIRMAGLHDYIKAELQPVLQAIKDNKDEDDEHLLDIAAAMKESGMPKYSIWQSKVVLKTKNMSVPNIHAGLNTFLTTANRNQFLPPLNEALRKTHSSKRMLYLLDRESTLSQNFYGKAMQFDSSSITVEKADYTDGSILVNLSSEMLMMLTGILFFSQQAKDNFEIEVSVIMKTNSVVYFHPQNSLTVGHVTQSFTLDSPFKLVEVLTNIHTSTLADLLQKIMHGFTSKTTSVLNNQPFLTIKRDLTEPIIENIKKQLGIIS